MDERALIQDILTGNTEAFADLIRPHQRRVRLACLVWLGQSEEADDAAQDVFLKAFQSLSRFKQESSFLTWILRIADNHCRDLLRARGRRRTESLDALFAEQGDAMEHLINRRLKVSDPIPYDKKEWELLGRLFTALSEDEREIILLSEVEELSYPAMADRLHCTLDAVKGRLKRARQNLLEKCRLQFPDLP